MMLTPKSAKQWQHMKQNKVLKFDHGITNWIILGLVLFKSPISAAQNGTILPPPPPAEDNNTVEPKIKVTPSMAIVLVCLVSGFFIMGCVSRYVRQCTERSIGLSFNEPEMGIHTRRGAVRGLDPTLIDTFPTFVYSDVKGRKIGKTTLECAVCLNEFEDDEILRLLPMCNHVFHPDCIDTWLASHITCPVCRANLVPRPGELRSVTLLSHGSDYNNPLNSETQQSSEPAGNEGIIIEIEPIEVVNPSQTPNRNRPPRTNSWKAGFTGKLPRSHSTGQLVIQPNDNCERFTLRLPDEVRSKLGYTSFNRTKSCVAFPRSQSVRKGYRSSRGETIEGKYYERFDREDQEESSRANQWGFMRTPHFLSQTSSVPSESRTGRGDSLRSIPMNMFRSVQLPFDKIFGGPDKERDDDDVGERSFDRLKLGGQS